MALFRGGFDLPVYLLGTRAPTGISMPSVIGWITELVKIISQSTPGQNEMFENMPGLY